MNGAIVGLVRGYLGNLENYNDLIQRNISIDETFNKKSNYPLILFHEDNFIKSDRDYVQENSPSKIEFINVSNLFKLKDESLLNSIQDLDRFNIGYRLMCRFNSLFIWDFVKDFDYILRVDEDIVIKNIDNSFFETMKSSNIVFKTGSFVSETHTYTNKTLPGAISKKTGLNEQKFYNHKFPYTNVYASKVDFWLQDELNKNLKSIVKSNDQIINRWGDLPILGFLKYLCR